MRDDFVDNVLAVENDDLLTTGEAAKLLGVTRQHVIDLSERGEIPYSWVGSHRRIRRSDLQLLGPTTSRMTADQRRSLWLGVATAGKIVLDPALQLEKARNRVDSLKSPNQWDKTWIRLLNGPLERVLTALTSPTIKNRELRQNSPFVDVLTELERAQVLRALESTRSRA